MSLFGNLFSGEDKTVQKKKSGKAHKKKENKTKKVPQTKAESKKEEKAKELVFNSDREVENYYREERERAKDFLKQVEKQKAASLIDVAKKQFEQVKTEGSNLDLLMKDLVSHAKNISEKIRETEKDKENNKKNINFVKKLKGSFFKLEKEAHNILDVRKSLANKEKTLIDKMGKIAKDSVGKLRLSDSENAEKLLEIEYSKEKLIDEAKTLLLQENHEMILDDKVLEDIGRIARGKIKRLNKKIKELRREKLDTFKRKQLLEISAEKAKEKILLAEKNIDKLKRKYHRVLGLK